VNFRLDLEPESVCSISGPKIHAPATHKESLA
jgi:hypothetical protein